MIFQTLVVNNSFVAVHDRCIDSARGEHVKGGLLGGNRRVHVFLPSQRYEGSNRLDCLTGLTAAPQGLCPMSLLLFELTQVLWPVMSAVPMSSAMVALHALALSKYGKRLQFIAILVKQD